MIEILKVGGDVSSKRRVITCMECNTVFLYHPSDLNRYNQVRCPICGRENWDTRSQPYQEYTSSIIYKGEMECDFSKKE